MDMKKKTNRRSYTIFAIVLSLLLTFTMIPPTFAADGDSGDVPATTQNGDGAGSGDQGGSDTDGDNNGSDQGNQPASGDEGDQGDGQGTEGDDPASDQNDDIQAPAMNMQQTPKMEKQDGGKPDSYGTAVDLRGNGSDKKPYIQAVDVKRNGSNDGPNDWTDVDDDNPVQTGDDVKFIITFNLPVGTLKYEGEGTNTVKYNITPPIGEIFEESGTVKNEAGKILGYYKITPKPGENPTGEIEIVFTDEAVRSNQTSRLDKGRVSFTSSVDGWSGTDDGVEDVPIGGDAGDVEIIIQPQDAVGDIKIRKKSTGKYDKCDYEGKFDSATGDAAYLMEIVSTSGTNDLVTVDDTMTLEVMKGQGNFKVMLIKEDGTRSELTRTNGAVTTGNFKVVNKDGSTTFNDSDGNHDDQFTMTLPKMEPNDRYVIYYEAYYPKMVNGNLTAKNTAIARSKDENDTLLISSSTRTDRMSNKPLDKTGELVVDDSTEPTKYYIEWTVIINPKKVDIGGWSLKDTGLYNDNQTNLTAEDIKLIKNAEKQEDGSYTGEVIHIDDKTLDGTTTIYEFPEGDTSNYVLQYKTPVDFDNTKYEVKNTIKMDPPPGDQDNQDNNPESTTPGIQGIDTDKEHEPMEVDLSDPKNPKAYIWWKMKIDATAAPIPADSVFQDELGAKQEFEKSQTELKTLIETAFGMQGLEIEWIDPPNGKEKTQFKFRITSGIPVGKTIEFSYRSIIKDFDPAQQYTYTNNAKLINPDNETIGNPTDSVTYKPMINKYDSSSGKTTGTDRTTTHKVGDSAMTYNGNLQTIKWGWDINMPASYYAKQDTLDEYVIIRDELPEGAKPVYLAFGSDAFSDIANATESSPAEVNKDMPEWKASAQDVANGYAKNEGDLISDAAEFTLQAWTEESDGKYTVFVKIPKDAVRYYKMKPHEYKLYAEIPEDWNWGTNDKGVKQSSFENNVFLIPDSKDVTDSVVDSKHTQVVIYDENERAIIKGHEYDKGKDERTIPYRIVVNEEEKDLLPGGSTLDFKDTLTATYPYGVSITLIPESFKVYIVDKDSIEYKKNAGKHDVVDTSKIRRLKDITDSVSYNHEAGRESGDDWIITAKLPDNKAILVQYDYHISGYTTGRERVNLKNISEISGVANDSNNDEWSDEISVQKSDSGIEIMRITLEKVDRANGNKTLEGAVFELYVYDGSKYIEIGKMVTNKDGQLILDTGHIREAGGGELEFNYNTAYRLIEVRPPKGYKLNKDPIDFYVMDRDDPVTSYEEEEYIPNDFSGYLLGTDSFLYFDNVRAKPSFKVKKVSAVNSAEVGDVIEYTIKATNTSKDDAYDCTIVDIMGKGLEYVDDSLGGDNQGQTTTWTVDIMAGETVEIQFYARVKSSAGDDVTNTAKVLYEGVDATTQVKDAEEVPVEGDRSANTRDRAMIYGALATMLIAAALAIVVMRRRRAADRA
jgi:uncharacterized repeat protein (TIGR01451 family)